MYPRIKRRAQSRISHSPAFPHGGPSNQPEDNRTDQTTKCPLECMSQQASHLQDARLPLTWKKAILVSAREISHARSRVRKHLRPLRMCPFVPWCGEHFNLTNAIERTPCKVPCTKARRLATPPPHRGSPNPVVLRRFPLHRKLFPNAPVQSAAVQTAAPVQRVIMDDLARRQRQTGIRLVARSTVGDAVNLDIIFSFFPPGAGSSSLIFPSASFPSTPAHFKQAKRANALLATSDARQATW